MVHCLDMALRYPEACVLTSKEQNHVVDVIERIWVRRWGAPYTYLFDLGGEFGSKAMEEHCRAHSTEMLVAPRKAHCMIGMVERHGYILKAVIVRILIEGPTLHSLRHSIV